MSAPENKTAPMVVGVIENMRDVPVANLLSGAGGSFPLSEEFRGQFAVLGIGGFFHLVVANAARGSPRMFDVRGRMQKEGMSNMRVIYAVDDILRLIYAEEISKVKSQISGSTSVEKLAQEIISAAADEKASDIHIETRGFQANVFFRIHGIRRLHREITSDNAMSLGVVLYSVYADPESKDVTWDPSNIMDGALEWVTLSGENYQLRFSSGPIYPSGGFHIVIRLLSMEAEGQSIDQLGYTNAQLNMLDLMTSGSSGMVIACGPTNSGKSTTLQALMRDIHIRRGDGITMISVEDPVEYVMPGVCQMSVSRKRKTHIDSHTGSAFTTFLRGTLRQDPDVVMVGEIRDHDSAVVVKDMVLAGRKLLTTLHTYKALWAYIRLREIGVPWEILTTPGFVAGIVYQRLVPVLCPKCSISIKEGGFARMPADAGKRVQQVSDLEHDDVRVMGDGCPNCHGRGTVGRTVCAEFVFPDRTLLRHLNEENFLEAERYWRKAGLGAVDENGGVTALAHGIAKMRKGLVSPLDIEQQIGILTSDMVNEDMVTTNGELAMLSGSLSGRTRIRAI